MFPMFLTIVADDAGTLLALPPLHAKSIRTWTRPWRPRAGTRDLARHPKVIPVRGLTAGLGLDG
jgi:hypothetical protein